jgi:hypothetical protein
LYARVLDDGGTPRKGQRTLGGIAMLTEDEREEMLDTETPQ